MTVRTAAYLLAVLATCLVAPTAYAESDDDERGEGSKQASSPRPSTETRAWELGLRGSVGASYVDEVNLCIFSSSCSDWRDTYGVFGARLYGSLGRPGAGHRWQTSLEEFYGPDFGGRKTFGVLSGGRLLTGVQAFFDGVEGDGAFWELGAGVTYFHMTGQHGSGAGMLGLSAAIGDRFGHGEMAVRVNVDSIVFVSALTIAVEGGFELQP